MEVFLESLVRYVAFVLELISILIIIISGTKALFVFIKDGFKFNNMRVSLIIAEGLNMSLGFLLAAEITSSIVIKTIPNLIVLFGTAALRIGLTFVLHWEIGQYEKVLDHDDPKGAYYKDTELKGSKRVKENKND
ncbi:MAG: DUF1622 domain-containing protein [Clostridiales bacterium]|nr:DUF1622 domain-containing protein [Clostridiales bacterium]